LVAYFMSTDELHERIYAPYAHGKRNQRESAHGTVISFSGERLRLKVWRHR
jgi:hypothetical protein